MNASKSSSDLVRIDQWLFQNGFAQSRTHGAALVEAKQVEWRPTEKSPWVLITKTSYKIPADQSKESFRLLEGPANRFVSRGGLKLEGALNALQLDITHWQILDVGVSTGGFSDCCLQKGADQVVGIDVGHGQLAPLLLENSRFQHFEGINAKQLQEHRKNIPVLQQTFDLIVGDLSFISITSILSELPPFLKKGGRILFLVKPQFELDSQALNKKGIVKNPKSYDLVKAKVQEACANAGLSLLSYFESAIEGKDGNREFFLFARDEKTNDGSLETKVVDH